MALPPVAAPGHVALAVGTGGPLWSQHCLLQSTASRVSSCQELWHVGSVVVSRGLSCSVAGGILLNQGLNMGLLH